MSPREPVWRKYLRFFGVDVEADIEDEIQFHLETRVDELRAAGLSPREAHAEALRQFGDVRKYRTTCGQIGKERLKKMNRAEYFAGWRQDITYAARQLRRNLGFTLAACLTLALGISSVTAIFSVIYSVVLRPLPFPDADRIVTIWSMRDGNDDVVVPRNFDVWRQEAASFVQVAALQRQGFTLTDTAAPIQLAGGKVSADFFETFAVPPLLGRTFSREEDQPGQPRVAVLSNRLWKQRFDSAPAVIGREIHLDRIPHTVIGVMPASFDVRPEGEQIWVPLALSGQEMNWTGGVLYVFGRLRPNVPIRQAQTEMDLLASNLETRYPELNKGRGIRVGSFAEDLVGGYRQSLLVLLGAVLFVLFIACANVANLLLARGTGRTRELGTRSALGASAGRLLRQLLTESGVLAIVSVLIGIVFSVWGIRAVQAMSPAAVPRLSEASLNGPTLLFALLLGLATTLIFGALPALRTLKGHLEAASRQAGRGEVGSVRDWVRNSYIAAEVGLALVLVSGAGLLVRSAIAARQQDPGFVAQNVLTAKTALPSAQYADVESVIRAYEQILERVATIPAVSSVSVASKVPLAAGSMGLVLKQDAVAGGLASTDLSVNLHYVGPDYLTAMEIPLQAGRDFSVTDRRGAHRVILVNETLARRLWARGDAVGQTLRMPELGPNNPLWEVVGVVGDVRENGLMQPVPPAVFIPFRQIGINAWQWTQQSLYIVAKTGVPPLGLADELRQAIGEVDPQLPVGDLLSMDQRFAASLATARLYALLLSSLGIAGLLLTAVGIYGVVAYFVARQRGEIALRMALGATPRQVLTLAMKQGMKPVGIGLLAGTLMAFGFTRVLTTQLYEVTASDPATLLAAIGLIALVAALACFLPALKSTRIEPMKALRGE